MFLFPKRKEQKLSRGSEAAFSENQVHLQIIPKIDQYPDKKIAFLPQL